MLLLLMATWTTQPADAQVVSIDRILPDIEAAVERAMLEGRIPSLTIAVVRGDRVVWSEGYGESNLWAHTPAVPSTVYLIGSTFKAMSTVALLQQAEAGKFSLDDAVGPYIRPLRIRGEDPDNPIRFRHLLTHTSGMPADFGPHTVWGDSSPAPIEEYLATSLRTESPPLENVVYSNMAYTLVGYLVQRFSETDYREYIREHIFAPLEMTSTAFAPTPEMVERLAVPYLVDEATEHHRPAELLKADVWPAGIVYGTVLDQANWLIMNLNDGVFRGRRVIGADLLDQMHTRQYDEHKGPISGLWGSEVAGYGLTWWTDVRGGERYFAHSGSVPGYTAFIQGNKDRKIGVAILSNGNRAHPHLIKLADRVFYLLDDAGTLGH